MSFQVDHNVLAFWFFILVLFSFSGFLLYDFYKDKRTKKSHKNL